MHEERLLFGEAFTTVNSKRDRSNTLGFIILPFGDLYRYVIHTVGPRYNVKYQTAADSALYFCYRNSMLIVRYVYHDGVCYYATIIAIVYYIY